MNYKSPYIKTSVLGVVFVWAFFVPVLVNARVIIPTSQSKSLDTKSSNYNSRVGTKEDVPTFVQDQSSQVGANHTVTPEMLHKMQELQNEGNNPESNVSTDAEFSWQNGLVTGLFASMFHRVNIFAKNNFSNAIVPLAGTVASAYAITSSFGSRLVSKFKKVTAKVVRGVEDLGTKTIQIVKPVVKFAKDVVSPVSEFVKTYGAEAGTMGVFGAGLLSLATLKPVREWGVKQIAKGLKKLDSYAESFDTGSRTSLGMYGKGLTVGVGLTVVGLVAGLAMVTIEPELVQDSVGHAFVSTYDVATHPYKIAEDVKQAKNNFLNWSDNTSMYEKGIAVSKFSINSALALDGAQAVITKAAALKTGTIAEEAATHVPSATTQPPDFISGVKVISKGKEISSGTLDVNKTLHNFEKGIYKERIDSIHRNDMGTLPLHEDSYYTEYYKPTVGWTKASAGPERIVSGLNGEVYYTPDHYITFYKLK